VGGRLTGAIVADFEGARRYTLLANQSNLWPGIIADYPAGKIFTSRVVSMTESAGAFRSITGKINGRVPFAEARQAGLTHDAQAEVEVIRVDPATRQVPLRLRKVLTGSPALAVLPPAPAPAPVTAGLPAVGARLLGIVTSAVPEQQGRGGFLLLRLKGYENGPRAILHCTQMSQELREDLNDSDVDLINEEIMVQVTQVDPSRRRIALLELPRRIRRPPPRPPDPAGHCRRTSRFPC
jgi:hypothetical protein